MKGTARAALELMRPANILTAFADILAGFAVAGGSLLATGTADLPGTLTLLLLLVATFGLYGGGVVFNDYFDAALDAVERPERPIPSGRIPPGGALFLGLSLFVIALVTAFSHHAVSGGIAVAIVALTFSYNIFGKGHRVAGPLLMGLCRGGNLLLGISALPALLTLYWPLALIPLFYIASITLISHGEVSGGTRQNGLTALLILLLLTIALSALGFLQRFDLIAALPFLLLFVWRTAPHFYMAWRSPDAETSRSAVRRGVLSQILLNSVLAAGFADFGTGIAVFLLLPVSILLARRLPVT